MQMRWVRPLLHSGEVRRPAAGTGVAVQSFRAGHLHGSTYYTRFLPSARRAVAVTTTAMRESLHPPRPGSGAGPPGSVERMFPAKKDDQEHDPAKAMGEPGDSDAEVSQGPNSFSNSETSAGGADSVYGTPDATPSVALGDRHVPEAPAAS